MRSHLARELRIMMLLMVALLTVASWLNIAHPRFHEEDTMKYKLKYVRLRAVHEEERQRIKRSKPAAEPDSLEIEWRRILMSESEE